MDHGVKEPQKPEGGFLNLKFVERLIRHLLDNCGSEPFLSTWNSMGKQRNKRTRNVLGLKSKVLESENVGYEFRLGQVSRNQIRKDLVSSVK